jgi:hypothetical protein
MVLDDPLRTGHIGTATPYASNPVKTRADLAAFCTGVLDSLESHTSPLGSRVHLGYTATHYDEHASLLEGFSRPIWGLAALLAGGGSYAGTERWVSGLAAGTNPDGPEFWGDMRDKDQRMVECSAIGFSLAVAGHELWNPLSDKGKEVCRLRHAVCFTKADVLQDLGRWLSVMNRKEMPNTNWLWFRVRRELLFSKIRLTELRYLPILDSQKSAPTMGTKIASNGI